MGIPDIWIAKSITVVESIGLFPKYSAVMREIFEVAREANKALYTCFKKV